MFSNFVGKAERHFESRMFRIVLDVFFLRSKVSRLLFHKSRFSSLSYFPRLSPRFKLFTLLLVPSVKKDLFTL
jgi:hypothetical protein